MKQECIMKQFDFITSKTLDTLTEEQYNLFRDYLKICGLRVIDGHGIYTYVKKYGVYLDGGDLIRIYPTMLHKLKSEITPMQILQTINTMTTVQATNTHDIQQIDCLIAHHQAVIEDLQQQRDEQNKRHNHSLVAQMTLNQVLEFVKAQWNGEYLKGFANTNCIYRTVEGIKQQYEKLKVGVPQMIFYMKYVEPNTLKVFSLKMLKE